MTRTLFLQISNGISPSSSEPDVEKLVADVQQLQLKELDLKESEETDNVLSPTQTFSAPGTPSTPTEVTLPATNASTPETPKACDAASSPIVFPTSSDTSVPSVAMNATVIICSFDWSCL